MRALRTVVFAALLCVSLLAEPARADGAKILVLALGGDKAVSIFSGNTVRRATEGMELHAGDKVRTGIRASCKILFPDGSKVLLGKDAQLEVAAPRGEAQQLELQRGELRGFVKKPARGGGAIKFQIRTRAAVMGVRGTDFVFDYDDRDNVSELHTLHGTVDIARDETLLRTGGVREVDQNETVRSSAAAEIPRPEEFDPRAFIKSLTDREPAMMSLARQDMGSFADEYPLAFKKGADLPSFRLNGIYTRQSSGGTSFSPELQWTPGFIFSRRLAARAFVGGFLLNGRTLSDRFVGVEFGGLLALSVTSWLDLEGGLGAETWLGSHGDLGLIEAFNVAYRIAKIRWIDRVFVGLDNYGHSPSGVPGATSGNSALQLKAGLGLYF